jgi:uncharacterized repeat protein (TIGR03803 family)
MACILKRVLIVSVVVSGLNSFPDIIAAQTFDLLHAFTDVDGPNATNIDGANPFAGLLLSGDTLYGTSKYGGSSGWGTLFAIKTNGTGFIPVHQFTAGGDGANPVAELMMANNMLYGTATAGGDSGVGTVFGINNDGTVFTTLHSFTKPINNSFGVLTNSDGAHPLVSLILSGSSLFGAANDGGTSGHGTIFTVGTNITGIAALHSFSSGTGGAYSAAGLVLLSNTLYGTDYSTLGNGAIFAINTDGSGFTNYYAFTASALNNHGILTNSDGANPHAKLVLCGNTLYGTAQNGGTSGNGTVFAINTDGSGFTTLHSFAAGAYNTSGVYTNNDGTHPSAELILSGDSLYGTATAGGNSGQGTVFMLTTNGSVFVNLYSFTSTPPYPAPQTNSDGANPCAGLVLSGNALFGTTSYGGSSGNGTVFSLSFAPTLTIVYSETNVILRWPLNDAGFDFSNFYLQSAPSLTGVFTNIPSAQSSYTNVIIGAAQFFRLGH